MSSRAKIKFQQAVLVPDDLPARVVHVTRATDDVGDSFLLNDSSVSPAMLASGMV